MRSIRAVPCTQFDVRPETSSARNRTSVWPWAEIALRAPEVAADQVVPPSVEVSYSYPARPETASVEPDAVSVIDGTDCQLDEPPATVGSVGFERSSFTVDPAVADDGVQADVLPAPSMDWNCTSVVPSALIGADAPAVVAPTSSSRRWSTSGTGSRRARSRRYRSSPSR